MKPEEDRSASIISFLVSGGYPTAAWTNGAEVASAVDRRSESHEAESDTLRPMAAGGHATPLTFRCPAPDPVQDVIGDRIFEAGLSHGAFRTDRTRHLDADAFSREEDLRE
jgi:hypothetical protein